MIRERYIQIPNNQDGRAPCAAIPMSNENLQKFDFDAFLRHCKQNLPTYAVPVFLRFQPELQITATLKHNKGHLKQEGVDLSKVGQDPLYFLDPKLGKYVPITKQVYSDITTPNARL